MRIQRRQQTGFTLVEALFAGGLLGLVLGLGIPSLEGLLAGNAMVSEVNGLVTALHLARSTAVNRGGEAILCPSPDGHSCRRGGDWSQGYLLFVDLDHDRRPGPGDVLVRHHQSLASHGIRIRSSVHRPRVVYRYDGSSPGSNLTLTFCAVPGGTPPRAVILSNAGRVRLDRQGPGGRPLRCERARRR